MEDNDNDYVLAFDHFYTTNHIQILKSLLPFMASESFPMLPVLIKYMELQYTISLISKELQILQAVFMLVAPLLVSAQTWILLKI